MAPPTAMDFDLGGLRGADRAFKRAALYVILGTIVWLGAVLSYVEMSRISTVESSGVSTSVGQAVVFGGGAVALAILFLVMLVPSQLPGARHIRVDDIGVSLTYGSGRVKRYAWNDPRSQYILKDFSSSAAAVQANTTYIIDGVHLWNGQSLLSREAFAALLSAGNERKLIRSQYQGNVHWYPHPPLIYKIRGGRGG